MEKGGYQTGKGREIESRDKSRRHLRVGAKSQKKKIRKIMWGTNRRK